MGKEQNPAYGLLQIPFSISILAGIELMHKTFAVVPAAGRGARMGGRQPKQFLMLAGKPILAHTIEKLSQLPFITGIMLVAPPGLLTYSEEMVRDYCSGCALAIRVVEGGKERQDSVFNALQSLPADCEWVLIHDGVRPFASNELMEATWKAAQKSGAAIAAVSATDTIKRVQNARVVETLQREQIILVQTPQVFRSDLIMGAYREARNQGWLGTDDASFLERLNLRVDVVEGEYSNIKVTRPSDLAWAEWFLIHGRV